MIAPESSPAGPHRIGWRFWLALAAFLYMATTIATQGKWLASGAMWAEMATNYYPNAHAADWSTRLFSTDSGYWPMPQRLIALAGAMLRLPARATPYVYGATSLVLGALMVASFCHRAFRPLLSDDRVRFVACVAFSLIPDFQTRTFINFTYLGFALAIPLIALAIARTNERTPAWAWALPLLMVSKPVFLALMPAIVLGLLMGAGRPRRVMAWSLVCGVAQLARLATSSPVGDNAEVFVDPSASLVMKLATSVASGAGMLADFTAGPSIGYPLGIISPWLVVAAGAALTAAMLLLLLWRRTEPAACLILVGISSVYAVALLNSFALSAQWTLRLDYLANFLTSRWSWGAIAGAIFAGFATAGLVLNRPERHVLARVRLVTFSVAWLICSGWSVAVLRAVASGFPTSGSSYWLELASQIDAKSDALCVPADPYQSYRPLFMYRDGCEQLNNGPRPDGPSGRTQPDDLITVPSLAAARAVTGLIVVVRPAEAITTGIEIEAVADTIGSTPAIFRGHRVLEPDGGIILLSPADGMPVTGLSGLRLRTSPSAPVMLGPDGKAAIIYLAKRP